MAKPLTPSTDFPVSRPVRSIGIVLLLTLALVLVGILAYQAQDAARSHRKTAERTLKDYASFANWQLTKQAKNDLLTSVISSLIFQASRVDPQNLAGSVLSPEQVAVVAKQTARFCNCLDSVQYFFRYDWDEGTLRTTATDLPDSDLAWARDTVIAYTQAMPRVAERGPVVFGSPDGRFGPLRQLAVILTNDSYAMIVGGRGSVQRLLVFVVARDRVGKPVVVYGYQTDPRPFVAPAFTDIHRASGLLPPSLMRDMSPDSVVSIAVTDMLGRDVYRSPGYFSSEYTAADTLERGFGRLITRVGLRPDMGDRLIVGGLPHSRLPILLALFTLTGGLLAVALVQMRRQQELARLRTEFVSGVSHELRTPLAQIRWFAELLHMGKLRSEDERHRSASIIDQEARRLTYLVENVLNFSRRERGTNRISPVAVDLEKEIRDVLEVFAPLARSRRVTLRAELDLGVSVSADRDAFRQILLNLLDNAAKYGPPGQTITIGMAVFGENVRTWIEDQGPGIPASDRERVWEPYVRLTRKNEEATGGSGIGLAVVRELVTMHGGRTWVEPGANGDGARVVVELPLLKDERPARERDLASTSAAG